MQSLLIVNLLLIVVTANSIAGLPLTLDSKTKSEATSELGKLNDRQVRAYTGFGVAFASRQARVNPNTKEGSSAVDTTEKTSTAQPTSSTGRPEANSPNSTSLVTETTEKTSTKQPVVANSRQGRKVYNAFGYAAGIVY